jgi:hypothetical protein
VRSARVVRSAWRRSGRLARWLVSRRLRSACRMIAQARVVGRRARVSLFNSTTTLAPKMTYSSSRRTHAYSSAAGRSRAGRAPRLSATNTRSTVGVAGHPLPDGLRVAGGHAEAVAGEGLAQRRPGGPELGRGVDTPELLGQGEGAFGVGPAGQDAAGLPAHSLLGMQGPYWSASARARSAFGDG